MGETERDKVTIQEAAIRLGLTESGIRKRVTRDQIEHEKGPDGKIYVFVDKEEAGPDNGQTNPGSVSDDSGQDRPAQDALVDRLESEVEFLRGELGREREANRENRRLLAAALERIPALEAPPDTTPPEPAPDQRESPVTASADSKKKEEELSQEAKQQRSWVYRLFFGP